MLGSKIFDALDVCEVISKLNADVRGLVGNKFSGADEFFGAVMDIFSARDGATGVINSNPLNGADGYVYYSSGKLFWRTTAHKDYVLFVLDYSFGTSVDSEILRVVEFKPVCENVSLVSKISMSLYKKLVINNGRLAEINKQMCALMNEQTGYENIRLNIERAVTTEARIFDQNNSTQTNA